MQVIIVGCGRVGAFTAAALARSGNQVTVIDRDPIAFRLLPVNFGGATLVGYAYDKESLEKAGIAEADAFVAVTAGDNTNVVAARVAKEVYRVPDVVSRIYDPQRAEIYRRFGIQTFAPTAWSSAKIVELIESPTVERTHSFGNGEVQLVAAWTPQHLVGKSVHDLNVPGEIQVALIVRMGRGFIPVSGTQFEPDDQIQVVVHQTSVERFQKMMGWKS
jgi:trk system potassium uptake protein TrkA